MTAITLAAHNDVGGDSDKEKDMNEIDADHSKYIFRVYDN